MPGMSRALESALQAVARMRGDSEVSMEDLKKVLATALKTLAGGATRPEGNDRDEQPH